MASNTVPMPIRHRLEAIHSRTWEHPADRAALGALRAIPGFDEVLKKIVGAFGERGVRLAFQADSVLVSERQFPRLHRLWRGALDTLDAPEEYPLYISQSPNVNAGAFGIERPWVMLLSGSLRLLDDDEVAFVMGHELGHVLSGHPLYHTMLVILIQLAGSGLPLLGAAAMPIKLALMEWYRKSELSADRAGLLAVQQPAAAMGTMMRLAGGGFADEMDLNAFLAQAEGYRRSEGILDQVFKLLNTLNVDHPFLVMRAALLRDWVEEGAYDRILRGEYPRRGDGQAQHSLRQDVDEALRHYTGGAQGAAERAGETVRRMREAFERGKSGSQA